MGMLGYPVDNNTMRRTVEKRTKAFLRFHMKRREKGGKGRNNCPVVSTRKPMPLKGAGSQQDIIRICHIKEKTERGG